MSTRVSLVIFVIVSASLLYNWTQAVRGLVPEASNRALRIFAGLEGFGRRESFTAEGWRYRNRYLATAVVWLAFVIVWGALR